MKVCEECGQEFDTTDVVYYPDYPICFSCNESMLAEEAEDDEGTAEPAD